MKYGRILPSKKSFDVIESDDFQEAKRMCGLDPLQVDHGTLRQDQDGSGVAIVVYEYGLFGHRNDYFVLGQNLYAGPALIYAYDGQGDTVDFTLACFGPVAEIKWFNSVAEVEGAIKNNLVMRPETRLNNELLWQWPDERPEQ